jgi:hypothetical protein
MSGPFAYGYRGEQWAVLHAPVVVDKEETLQTGEGYSAIFFTESNVTLAWLGTLLSKFPG